MFTDEQRKILDTLAGSNQPNPVRLTSIEYGVYLGLVKSGLVSDDGNGNYWITARGQSLLEGIPVEPHEDQPVALGGTNALAQ